MTRDFSRYLVTDAGQIITQGRQVTQHVQAAVAGGVTAVQLREKTAPAREFLELLCNISAVLPPRVTLIVNDRVDVFLAARAQGIRVDGVHLGQSDLPATLARQLTGPKAIIGLSVSTTAQVREAERSGAAVNYVGIGAVHPTQSKDDPPPALGINAVVSLAQNCAIAAVAIGGITPPDLPLLRRGGLAGAAVVSWICSSSDPRAAAAQLRAAWEAA